MLKGVMMIISERKGYFINPISYYLYNDELQDVVSEQGDNITGLFDTFKLKHKLIGLDKRKIYNFKTTNYDSILYLVAELSDSSDKREIELFYEDNSISLSGKGKFTNPQIVHLNDFIYCAYEQNYLEDGMRKNAVRIKKINPNTGKCTDVEVSPFIREYCPKLCVAGDKIILITEVFSNGRYRIIARILCGERFYEGYEIGCSEYNDQSPSVAYINGNIIVVFENSRCLEKNYVYELFPKIVIPSFGHGWRIDTKIYIRQLKLDKDTLLLGELISYPKSKGKSDGVCSLYSSENKLFMSYYKFNLLEHKYVLSINQLSGSDWVELYSEHNKAYSNKPVSMILYNNELYFSHIVNRSGHCVLKSDNIQVKNEISILSLCDFKEAYIYDESVPIAKNPKVTLGTTEYNVYYGDLHMHSNISICSLHYGFHCSEIEDKYRICSDLAGLDFAMCTDHDTMDDLQWARSCEAANFANNDGVFTAFIGYEWTSSMYKDGKPNFGHMNVLYKEDGKLLRCRNSRADTAVDLWSKLGNTDALTIPHHTADYMHPFDWDYYNEKFQTIAEIFNVRGSYEYDDCDLYPTTFGRPSIKGLSLDTPLKKGYKLGFTSGGEHEGCGITMVLAENLTREAIFEALKARRVYGSTGAKIIIKYTAGKYIMGEIAKLDDFDDHIIFKFSAEACENIKNVRLMKNSKIYCQWDSFSSNICEVQKEVLKEAAYYYFTLMQEDNEMCWSSPIWFE